MKAKTKRRFFQSIAFKLFFSTFLCLLLLVAFNWMLNNFALASHYQNEKERLLANAYVQINSIYDRVDDNGGENSVDYKKLNDLSIALGGQVMIWDDYRMVFSSRMNIDVPQKDALMLIPNLSMDTGTYQIANRRIGHSGQKGITLVGRLNNGYKVIMNLELESMEESVSITNRFLLYSGIAALVIGALAVAFVVRSFTRPIRDLSRVAGSLSRLDFTDRYKGSGNDELSELGNSINRMASALQSTISGLKTANLQLLNDNEQKTKQNEARRSFIANVSHELKTPISLIQTYAEGLHEDIAADAGSREYYCSVIEDEADKMSMLIKKMTMLMQLEAGNEELVIERFDISELLQNLIQRNEPRFLQKQVNVQKPPEEPVFVWADEFLIENVISNYLSNALNHVEEGGTISVSVKRLSKERVRIAVFNTGSHIPEEDLSRIWESFYKVDKAHTRAYGGTGIGLSVVTAIMKAHHMPYGVINRDNGVEFTIELETR